MNCLITIKDKAQLRAIRKTDAEQITAHTASVVDTVRRFFYECCVDLYQCVAVILKKYIANSICLLGGRIMISLSGSLIVMFKLSEFQNTKSCLLSHLIHEGVLRRHDRCIRGGLGGTVGRMADCLGRLRAAFRVQV